MRDQGPGPAEPQGRPTIRTPGGVSDAAQVLKLQSTIGNRNVGRLLGRAAQTRQLQRDWTEPEWHVPLWAAALPYIAEGIYERFAGTIDIAVVDANDVTGWLSSAMRGHALEVDNIPDMVDKVLGKLRPGQKIGRLYIDAHGSPGVLYVGSGSGAAGPDQILSTSTLPSQRAALGRWTGRFVGSAVVTIGGCQVAANSAGTSLLGELATLWGVDVRAGSDYQRPLVPGLEGPVTRCSPSPGGAPTCDVE